MSFSAILAMRLDSRAFGGLGWLVTLGGLGELEGVDRLGKLGGLGESDRLEGLDGLGCPNGFGGFNSSFTGLRETDAPGVSDFPLPTTAIEQLDGLESDGDVESDSGHLLILGCTFDVKASNDDLLRLLLPWDVEGLFLFLHVHRNRLQLKQ